MSDNKLDLTDRITVVVNGEERQLFMSAQMRNRLINLFQSGEFTEGDLALNAKLQENFIVALLTPKNPKQEDIPNFDDLDISVQDYDKLSQWAAGHVLDFFMKAAQAATQTAEMLTKAYSLPQLTTGSEG